MFSLAELCQFGLTRDGVMRRVRAGRLHRRYPGVYAVGYPVDLPEARFLAAVKACGDRAVLSFRASGWLSGFLEGDEPRPEVTVEGPGKRTIPGITIHRSLPLHPQDRARHPGVPTTSAARTIVDLASVLDEPALRQVVRRAQGLRRVNLPLLIRTMDRLGPRRGTTALRNILATGPAPTKTVLEDVVLDLLLAAGFKHPDVNKPLTLASRRIVPDFRWPEQRLIVEADSAWHDQKLDAERQALLEAHGERVLRVTWEQAVTRPHATIARVAAAGAPY